MIGLGLIGASIAGACRRAGLSVCGSDTDAANAAAALELGLVDVLGPAPVEVTFVATPAASVPDVVGALGPSAGVVSDVAGVKAPVVARCDAPRFVGGHPFAGSERSGPGAARADLFDGAAWVLTPGPSSDPAAVAALSSLVSSLGASPLVMGADEHDRLAAAVSHVPHLVAAALASAAGVLEGVDPRVRDVVAGGFGGVTRVAASPVSFWPALLVENRDQVLAELDRFAGELDRLRAAVAAADPVALAGGLESARRARGRVVDGAVVLDVEVRDEPGSMSAVLDVLAAASVDVVDVELVPLLDRPAALLRVVLDSVDAALAHVLLGAAGFSVLVEPVET